MYDPVRVGIIGLGFGRNFMKEVIGGPNGKYVKIAAACDTDPERLQKARNAFGCHCYSQIDDMLRDPAIEAVCLFTNPHGRAQIIQRVLSAGKHIFTTKPFELDSNAAQAVLNEAAKLGRVIHLNSPSTIEGDDIAQIRRWQREHDLGQVVFLASNQWYPSREKADGSWYDSPDQCPVAPILRLGIYGINDMIAIMDEGPIEMQALCSRMFTGRPTADVAVLSMRFPSGPLATVRATWCCAPETMWLECVFERGVIRRETTDRPEPQSSICTLHLTANGAGGKIIHDQIKIAQGQCNWAYRWDMFYRNVREGQSIPAIDPHRIVEGVRVLEGLYEAQKTGRTISLNNRKYRMQ